MKQIASQIKRERKKNAIAEITRDEKTLADIQKEKEREGGEGERGRRTKKSKREIMKTKRI